MLQGKRIILGVTGGIAAYKAAALCSVLVQAGAEVRVLMTEHAKQFVGPATFEALSGRRVISDTFSSDIMIPHIRLAKEADLFVVAPATANSIAKLSCGIADDMLTSTFLACTCERLIVPAMNVHMYENAATQNNIAVLRSRGIAVMDPAEGHLAEGSAAKGKMPEPSVIFREIEYMIGHERDLAGKKIVITAGPTAEAIDPVRYITNHSTGKMGYALAKAASVRGAQTVLISGPVREEGDSADSASLLSGGGRGTVLLPAHVRRVFVTSAADMAAAVKEESANADCVIMAAAVADFTPAQTAEEKLKKDASADGMTLPLNRTEDILSWLGSHKKAGQRIVGFSMETEHLLENSRKKLSRKNTDMIVANSLRTEGAGFGTNTNAVTMVSPDCETELPLLSKEETAHRILDRIF